MPSRQIHAVCTHDCPDSCGILVTVDELTGRATRIQGDPSHPVTRGFLCGKVARYLDRVYSPDRMLFPMRRKPGIPKGPLPKGREAEAFERISWDQALDEIAARLQQIAREHGPESILPYSYAGTIGQLGYGSMDRRFFHRLGASQLDRTICSASGTEALNMLYGTRLGTPMPDFAHAGLIVVWGGNVHGNNIHLWPFIEEARRHGARLIVIDPYRTRTAALADEHLAIRPGADVLLALAVMHVLFRENLHDEAYLNDFVPDWQQLRAHALREEHSPGRAATITGLPAEAIESLAQTYGQSGRNGRKPAAIRLNYGIQRSENGGTAARAVAMLPLITGSWKQRGGGFLLSMSGAFGFNSKALQRPDLMQQSPLGHATRMVNMNQLGDALTELTDPPVKALFVYNCNAAAVAPDSNRVLAGLRRDDLFTVVHEQFFTDTTDYADFILPATTFLEHKELMGSYGHTVVQLSEPAIAPLGEARPNYWLFAQLGQRMGFDPEHFDITPEQLIDQVLDSPNPALSGITRERLEQQPQLQLNLPATPPFSTREWFPNSHANIFPLPEWHAPAESPFANASSSPAATLSSPATTLSSFAAGGGSASPSQDAQEATHAFPLQFLPRKADNYMNSTFANLPTHQAMERRTAGVLEIHSADACARNIREGDEVSVFNQRGRIALTATIANARVAPGVVSARLDWHKLSASPTNVNALTSQRLSDLGGGATFYSVMVEVQRAEPLAAD